MRWVQHGRGIWPGSKESSSILFPFTAFLRMICVFLVQVCVLAFHHMRAGEPARQRRRLQENGGLDLRGRGLSAADTMAPPEPALRAEPHIAGTSPLFIEKSTRHAKISPGLKFSAEQRPRTRTDLLKYLTRKWHQAFYAKSSVEG